MEHRRATENMGLLAPLLQSFFSPQAAVMVNIGSTGKMNRICILNRLTRLADPANLARASLRFVAACPSN